jgi:hypothetical protein
MGPRAFYLRIPPSFINFLQLHYPMELHIGTFEGMALLMGILKWTEILKKGPTDAFVDNQGAIGAVLKGVTTGPVNQAIVECIRKLLYTHFGEFQLHYIKSELNPADLLTRKPDITRLRKWFPGLVVTEAPGIPELGVRAGFWKSMAFSDCQARKIRKRKEKKKVAAQKAGSTKVRKC